MSSEDGMEESGDELEQDSMDIEKAVVNKTDHNSDTGEKTSETEILEPEVNVMHVKTISIDLHRKGYSDEM